ncbi:Major sperm protein 78 [Trichinella zimbabwensis]|uniref:Major sperm protein n=1 Tax=Trichinella zimbabwensis TaxID=268475 RepID=A0A0V1I1W9_9BILA|nr:Major sperm protein 78 [Trichinella zimbabwensis]
MLFTRAKNRSEAKGILLFKLLLSQQVEKSGFYQFSPVFVREKLLLLATSRNFRLHLLSLRMALPTDIGTVPAEEVWFNAPCLSEQITALKISNPGKKLIGYRVVSKVENRYVVLPSQGALQPNKDLILNIICHPFPFRSESPPVDTLIIEWVDAFEGQTEFNEDWFVLGGIVRKKIISVKFNP